MEEEYQPQEIEKSTQKYWAERKTFEVKEDLSKEKFYCLSMFPYPSGHLHVGHARNYTIGDVIARYQRMLGKNVMQPMGWDAFGLPAENAAIKHNVPPAKWTYENIDAMRKQFKRFGYAYDWRREMATCKPEYYRWEQWLFTKLFKKGLVYRKNSLVNWDPVDQTVLANEQVINGRGWRSGAIVERREIPQWFLKITDYAEELLEGLNKLDQWPEQVRTMQRNWIGRSEGVNINFQLSEQTTTLQIYTTRPDTLFGVTYLAISPQHPLALQAALEQPALQDFLTECSKVKVAEAELATMEKRGMKTPYSAIHPLNGRVLPIWIANFVLMEYGSGAIMAVPAHDERDHEFAIKYHLSIQQVISPNDSAPIDVQKNAYTEPGILINSAEFNGLTSDHAFTTIANHLEKTKLGQRKINYRLRDWGISRQRYWGTPIPIIYCDNCGHVPVNEKDLPVVLPEEVIFTGALSPLKNMPEFYNTTCPTCGNPAQRETDTFDTFMESSWYYARFASFNQSISMLDDRATYWTPVDHYIGGIEHAVLHLLYARFLHKVLRDQGLLNSDEPFLRLLTQGMVLKDGSKMSKSKGNTVNPQELIEKFGADTIRLFAMFAAPPELSLEWSDSGVEGCHRFLKRVWAYSYKHHDKIFEINAAKKQGINLTFNWETLPNTEVNLPMVKTLRDTHKNCHEILQKICYDMEKQQFNTVVAGAMKLLNLLTELPDVTNTTENSISQAINFIIYNGVSIVLRILNPIAPHITHTLWRELAYGENIADTEWPKVNKNALKVEEIEMVVQINGKLRSKITVSPDADSSHIQTAALNDEKIKKHLAGQEPKKIIVIPGKVINIVVTEIK